MLPAGRRGRVLVGVARRARVLTGVAALAALAGLLAPVVAFTAGSGATAATSPGTAVIAFGDAGSYGSTGTAPLNRPLVGMAPTPDGHGYWLVASDGGVFTFGDAGFYGSTGGTPLNRPVVGIVPTPDGHGYWLVASDGGVFTFGDAGFYGSTGGTPLNRPVVGIVPTPDGHGYWLVASDGGVFTFGDAGFYGSMGDKHLNAPVVGGAATPSGGGYWLVASDGGVFTFGDAGFYGSTGSIRLNRPVVGMAATPAGGGYWLVAADGGIFNFGDAGFYGSTGSIRLNRPVVGMAATPAGGGYWLVASDGGVFTFGDARFYGSGVGALGSNRVAAGIIASLSGQGYDVLAVPGIVNVGFAGDVNGVGRVAAFMGAGGNPLSAMQPYLASNDVNIVNLETSVGTAGQAQDKQYTFQSPPQLVYDLKAAGVSVVNLANNHSLDYGVAGLLETISDAKAAGLLVVGAGVTSADAYAPAVVDTPAGTVAFLGLSQVVPPGWAATATRPGVASAFDLSAAVAAVQRARSLADHVVVMIHAGVELDQCPTADQRTLVNALIGAGADVVAGSHPHVLQGLQQIGSMLVDYSLGNFVWYTGAAATGLLSVGLGPTGVDSYQFTAAVIDGNGSPQPLSGAAAGSVAAEVASLAPGAGRC